MEKNAYKIRTATTTLTKMPAARLRLRMSAGFHFVFCSSSGSRRLSTKRTIGFRKERDHHAEDQRLQNHLQRRQHTEETRQIRKDHDEQNADKDHDQRRQTPFDVWLVSRCSFMRDSPFPQLSIKYHIRQKTSIQRFPRVYLKTHDVTGSEGFLRCARHFSQEY